MYRFITPVIFIALFAAGCSSKKILTDSGEIELIDDLNTVIDSAEHYAVKPDNISFKASAKIETPDKSNSFRINVSMKPDSVIRMSVIAYGMEIARILATKDSLFFVNKADKEYYRGDYLGLNRKFRVSLTFDELQSILLGNPVGLENREVLKLSVEDKSYMISNTSRRKLKKAIDGSGKITGSDTLISNRISPLHYRVERLSVVDLLKNKSLSVNYDNFEIHDEKYIIPGKTNIFVRSNHLVSIELEYSRVKINEEGLTFPFKFYDNYEPIR